MANSRGVFTNSLRAYLGNIAMQGPPDKRNPGTYPKTKYVLSFFLKMKF